MRKIVAIFVTTVVLALGIFLLTRSSQPSSTADKSQLPTDTAQQGNQQATSTYTKEEVAKHSNSTDCWTIIDGVVYDITSYIPRHDGGEDILRACGNDATSLFHTRRTEDGQTIGTGTPHSNMAGSQLSRLKIGTLHQD